MVIVKSAKLVSNSRHKGTVVQYLESVPTEDNPEVILAQRVSKLTIEQAQQEVGKQLNGIIIVAPCERKIIRPPSNPEANDGLYSDARNVYVEMGDDIINLASPIDSGDDIICDIFW